MGRAKPSTQVTSERRGEVLRARAVEAAMARLKPAVAFDAPDEEFASAVDAVLAELEMSQTDLGAEAPGQPRVLALLVSLDGLEVTQEVQDLAHSVPLIAGKPTIVRAYLSYSSGPIAVRGELLVARSSDGPWTAVPALAPAQLAPDLSAVGLENLRSRRSDLTKSLNFRLPDSMIGVGSTFVRLGAIRRVDGGDLPSVAGIKVREVTFQRAVPLRLHLIRFRYSMDGSPFVHEPSATDQSLIASWLRRAYPIAELQMTTTTVAAVPPFDANQINAQLVALRAADVFTGTDSRTHYYGLVADSGFFMRGLASDVPRSPRPETVACGPAGPGTFGWDEDGSYGDWYGGHELAHTFGRPHANFCGATGGGPYPFADGQLADADEAFVGIDVGDATLGLPMRALPGTTWHDVMSYCDRQWISSFTYRAIYNRLVAEDALPADTSGALRSEVKAGPMEDNTAAIHLIAAVDLTHRSGSITAVLPAIRDRLVDGGASDGPLSVRVVDDAGKILDERPVPFQRSVREESDDVTGLVDVVLPAQPRASTIEVLLDGEVLDSYPIGDGSELGAPVGQAQESAGPLSPNRQVELRWEAPRTSRAQRYIIQLSDDGGVSWRTIAVGLTDPAVTIRASDIAGKATLARVLTITGSGATVVRTDPVQSS